MLNPDTIIMSLSNLNFLSPDSRCYSFDHRANGYSRGEGFGVVVIKLVSKALRDGDTVRAVIRATGSNQDGRTPGITQHSKEAQESLIRNTYSSAGLDLRSTIFFETHGTGTPIGDPTEAGAIGGVSKDQRTPDEPLLIGAVKSNIGHLEGASGLASLIKTVMVLENAVIPPNICFERPHPSIQVNEWNIKVGWNKPSIIEADHNHTVPPECDSLACARSPESFCELLWSWRSNRSRCPGRRISLYESS